MNEKQFFTNLIALIKESISNFDDRSIEVIKAFENQRRPNLPFIQLQTINFSLYGSYNESEYNLVNDIIGFTQKTTYEITIQIDFYGDYPMFFMGQLQNDIRYGSTFNSNSLEKNICFKDVTGVRNLSDIIKGEYEKRASFDLELYFFSEQTFEENIIEIVGDESSNGFIPMC